MISTANVGIAVAFWKCNNNCKYMAYKHLKFPQGSLFLAELVLLVPIFVRLF